jgi:hypothetical protein
MIRPDTKIIADLNRSPFSSSIRIQLFNRIVGGRQLGAREAIFHGPHKGG